MIEDDQNARIDFVYRDDANENSREVVKSIMRSIIGDYEISSSGQAKQLQEEKSAMELKFGKNIRAMLNTTHPEGQITVQKFKEVLVSIGVELSDALTDWLIGKMAMHSSCLHSLQFRSVFSEE